MTELSREMFKEYMFISKIQEAVGLLNSARIFSGKGDEHIVDLIRKFTKDLEDYGY